MKVGVLGGTFDPIHVGHLAAARGALACGLDLILVVPSASPPHRAPAHAPVDDRLEMCRLAARRLRGVEVSDLEARRGGPSYTLDTLQELRRERPGAELALVLGWDAARLIRAWHRPDEILEVARLLILNRPGLPPARAEDLRAAGIDPGQATLCPATTPDVSASRIRERIRQGLPLAGLVPAAVERYIRERGLYQS
ncbi:MAG TPA: nicotinate (nicotinamide) nucleotide adenylyltransferase [Candidatus Acidoferrales bacterium]|nr:nicotinate (nicotinamide) nucleotide adenylyltransferase [Candidatus Acidoferrales bacterium]